MKKRTKPEQADRGTSEALTTLIRVEAKNLLAQVLEAEVAELLVLYVDQQDERGRALVVRSGHLPGGGNSDGDWAGDSPSPQGLQSKGRTGDLPFLPGSPLYGQDVNLGSRAALGLALKGILIGEMPKILDVLVGLRNPTSNHTSVGPTVYRSSEVMLPPGDLSLSA